MSSKVIDYIRKVLENSSSDVIDKCVNAWIDLCSVVGCNLVKPTNFGHDKIDQETFFFFNDGITELEVCVLHGSPYFQGSTCDDIKVLAKRGSGYMKATFYTKHLNDMSKMVARDIFCTFIDEDEDGE